MIKLKMLKQAGIVKGMATNPLYVFKKEKHKNYRKIFINNNIFSKN